MIISTAGITKTAVCTTSPRLDRNRSAITSTATTPTVAANLRITELHYHPADPSLSVVLPGLGPTRGLQFIVALVVAKRLRDPDEARGVKDDGPTSDLPLGQAELAAAVDAGAHGPASAIGRHDYGDTAPLSADQHRMWFLQRLQPDSAAYHVPLALHLRGPLDVDAIRGAVQQLVDRHEVLRTVFVERADGPVQKILPAGTPHAWELVETHGEASAPDVVAARIAAPFDLASEAPLRVCLVRTGADQHVLLLLFHHIAVDEWTTALATRELRDDAGLQAVLEVERPAVVGGIHIRVRRLQAELAAGHARDPAAGRSQQARAQGSDQHDHDRPAQRSGN